MVQPGDNASKEGTISGFPMQMDPKSFESPTPGATHEWVDRDQVEKAVEEIRRRVEAREPWHARFRDGNLYFYNKEADTWVEGTADDYSDIKQGQVIKTSDGEYVRYLGNGKWERR